MILHIARRPALGDCFGFRVEANAFHTMLVYITESRAFPTAKGMIGHRNRYRYINADHADIHLRSKFARCQTIAGEQCHAIAILVLARQASGILKAVGTHNLQNRAEYFILVALHVRCHAVEH